MLVKISGFILNNFAVLMLNLSLMCFDFGHSDMKWCRVSGPISNILHVGSTSYWLKFERFDCRINFDLPPKKKICLFHPVMLLSLSGRSFIKIQYSSFPLFPVAYPFRIATHYNITSSARNVR